MENIIFILNDVELLNEVLREWERIGIRGVTVMKSTGLGRLGDALYRDDAPLFPSLDELLEHDLTHHVTLMSVVESSLVDRVIEVTQQITGPLDRPNTGILFTMPINRVVGGTFGKER